MKRPGQLNIEIFDGGKCGNVDSGHASAVAPVEASPRREGKPPSARLLDLLAGWAEYVGNDEESGLSDPSLTSEEIADLYQEAGAECLHWEALGDEEQERAVCAFVEARAFPLLTPLMERPIWSEGTGVDRLREPAGG